MGLRPRDCAQVVWRAIESPLHCGILYAISRNSRRWDITETIEQLGYRPQDAAEQFATEIRGDTALHEPDDYYREGHVLAVGQAPVL
jgi:NAD+ dependent glucose-6-phosphate dehydrogenase